jgi:DNA-binding Lrp family transcriptional regulator
MARKANRIRSEPVRRALDRTDRVLLAAVQNNARLSNKELAAMADLAPSSCLERMRRLERDGVIRAWRAEIDPAPLGLGIQALLAVQLRLHVREAFESFTAHIETLPEAVAMWQLAGTTDFLVHLVCRDTEHLRTLTMDAFTIRPEVSRIETSLVFWSRRSGLPISP